MSEESKKEQFDRLATEMLAITSRHRPIYSPLSRAEIRHASDLQDAMDELNDQILAQDMLVKEL